MTQKVLFICYNEPMAYLKKGYQMTNSIDRKLSREGYRRYLDYAVENEVVISSEEEFYPLEELSLADMLQILDDNDVFNSGLKGTITRINFDGSNWWVSQDTEHETKDLSGKHLELRSALWELVKQLFED